MQDSLVLALPIVLMRLKQKETKWKYTQCEWNKIWHVVDAANYAHSLDHQGITSKMTRHAMLMDLLYARAHPQHQLAYKVKDTDVLCDAIKLTFSYPLHLSSTQLCLDVAQKNWVGVRLYSIVCTFFQLREWDMHQRSADQRQVSKIPQPAHPPRLRKPSN